MVNEFPFPSLLQGNTKINNKNTFTKETKKKGIDWAQVGIREDPVYPSLFSVPRSHCRKWAHIPSLVSWGHTLQVFNDAKVLGLGDCSQHTEGGLLPKVAAVLPKTGSGNHEGLELIS